MMCPAGASRNAGRRHAEGVERAVPNDDHADDGAGTAAALGPGASDEPLHTELVAVLVAVVDGLPHVLTSAGEARLPSGPLQSQHRSLQAGLRSWVEQQTGHPLGYVEQLYTFADRDRAGLAGRVLSVSYLGLTRVAAPSDVWRSWYDLFPWEDQRGDGPAVVDDVIAPMLARWVSSSDPRQQLARRQRCDITFGRGSRSWLPDLVLQRYELLYEAGLVPESRQPADVTVPGERMVHDHRRILATGIARLRTKSQYRPMVFELMPEDFTLGQLQVVVEAIAGQRLHKQNFRRLVAQQELVEPTGDVTRDTGGRPAQLYRFRREVLAERHVAGTSLPVVRSR
jgi:hypothetical protein